MAKEGKALTDISTINKEQGASYSIAGGKYRIVVSGEDTGGNYAVIEMMVPPGAGPGPHAHQDIQEMFYVVEGEVEFTTDAGKYIATKGSMINIPLGGKVHCFKNKSTQTAQLLCTVVPAGLDSFFKEIGKPVESGVILSSSAPDAEEMKRLQTIGNQYGQVFYPPDYFDR